MVLPRGLKRGAWMELDDRDIRALFQASGGAVARPGQQQRGPGQEGGGGNGRGGRNKKRRGNRNGGGQQQPRDMREARDDGGREAPIPNPLGDGRPPRGERGGRSNRGGGQPQGQGRRGNGNRQGGDRQQQGGGGNQPDPMKTSLGYIGADSFSRQRKEQRGGGQRRGGGGGGAASQARAADAAAGAESLPSQRGLSRGFHQSARLRRLKSEALSTCDATNSLQL